LENKRIIEVNAFMPHAYIIELLTDFFGFSTLRKFYEKRSRPKYGTSEYFWMVHQQLIDNPPPPPKPYVAPCGGVGNHVDPTWWEEEVGQDDYESPFARATRLKEEKERARVYGWDKLERPTSIIEP
jgi:hypothetical protein